MRKRVRRKIVKRAMGKLTNGEKLTFQERKLIGQEFIQAWDVAKQIVNQFKDALGTIIRSFGVAFNQAKEQIREAAKRAAEEGQHGRTGRNSKIE